MLFLRLHAPIFTKRKPTMKVIYTWDNCPVCDTAKTIIKEKNIDIQQVHIDPSTRAGRDIQMEHRIMGVPVIIDWEDRYVGSEVLDYLQNKE